MEREHTIFPRLTHRRLISRESASNCKPNRRRTGENFELKRKLNEREQQLDAILSSKIGGVRGRSAASAVG